MGSILWYNFTKMVSSLGSFVIRYEDLRLERQKLGCESNVTPYTPLVTGNVTKSVIQIGLIFLKDV